MDRFLASLVTADTYPSIQVKIRRSFIIDGDPMDNIPLDE
jgi:hypothetical protein